MTLSLLFCWCCSCLLPYLSEKRMNGCSREMTGDSSNISCLEALAVPSTNNSAQSAPKALIPAGLYTRGCILWCIQRRNIHSSVFSVYQAVAAEACFTEWATSRGLSRRHMSLYLLFIYHRQRRRLFYQYSICISFSHFGLP